MFSIAEVAEAAGVPTRRVRDLIHSAQIVCRHHLVGQTDAVRLVRALTGRAQTVLEDRPAISAPSERRRRGALSLVGSGLLHAAFLAALAFVTSLGWLASRDTDRVLKNPNLVHLVFLMEPGPGGGGGGGGTQTPAPPPRAERKSPVKVAQSSPVPPVRKIVPPPRPVIAPPPPPVLPPRVEPTHIDPPPPPTPQVVKAPVVPVPADAADHVGALDAHTQSLTNGPGIGGGVGAGAGPGLGSGQGSGIGDGSGGGTGGGPYQPGNGIDPPTLLREVKPAYTDEARRRAIEGNVVLQIIVRADGSVGEVRVLHTLAAGLEERAVDAVRQWRFSPARHQGAPVDVLVEVSVGFSMRQP
jgi:periplasmic protein TonB